jgi:hypothetical protein
VKERGKQKDENQNFLQERSFQNEIRMRKFRKRNAQKIKHDVVETSDVMSKAIPLIAFSQLSPSSKEAHQTSHSKPDASS